MIRESHDLAPMLKGLPGGNCSCPHWGYVLKGRIIVRYDDHEEVFEAGDAFYMPPGHTPEALNHPMTQRLIRNAVKWLLHEEH